MTTLTIPQSKSARLKPLLIALLSRPAGVTSDVLDTWLREHDPDLVTDDLVYNARIGWVGSLRVDGYLIPKIRGLYKITGWEEPVEISSADRWPQRQQDILASFEGLTPVSAYSELRARLTSLMSGRCDSPTSEVPHQLSPGYILSYELANDTGRYPSESDVGLIVKKFKTQPRFRMLLPNPMTPQSVTDLSRILGEVSRRNVKLMSVLNHPAPWPEYGWIKDTTRIQGLYNLESLADHNSLIPRLPSRVRSYVRRNLSELTLQASNHMSETQWKTDGTSIIDQWKSGPAGQKQRQLAIRRDYVALDLARDHIGSTSFIAYRRFQPVGIIIYDPINSYTVGDLVCKGLNHPSLAGGYHRTAFTMVMMVSQILLDQGYLWLNDGGLDGGTSGLYEYKQQIVDLVPGSKQMKTQDWVLPETTYIPGGVE